MPEPASPFYITTPIYYVNDQPHVGHCYTTLLADAAARFMRAARRDVFFLTGTDEHAEKVVESASKNNVAPIEWADRNAKLFQEAFRELGFTNDDFIRTTEPRHKDKVAAYVQKLMDAGEIALGDYEGWWDASQEEYVTENVAREHDFKSPITGRELVKRTEQNYFFDLPKHADWLLAHIESNSGFIRPEARKNEVVARIKNGLQRVPISRGVREGDADWGIPMPGDPSHRIYVWIDALINYLSTMDTDDRRKYWPPAFHLVAKDILWFHAIIWPCMLHAMGEEQPGCVYAHSFWIREGRKMSKSLGNFIDMPTIRAYIEAFGNDAYRWYMLTQGPAHATDADFAHAKFIETYNADLANGIGNAFSRVSNMIAKYFGGACPSSSSSDHGGRNWAKLSSGATDACHGALDRFDLEEMLKAALSLSNEVDGYIHETEPFKLAKDESKLPEVGTILYNAAEALRIAAVLLSPALPETMGKLLKRMGQEPPKPDGSFSSAPLEELCQWGRLGPGTKIEKGEALFPRADPDAPEPEAMSDAA